MSAKNIIKELLYFILLTAAVILLLMFLLYDFIPTETEAKSLEYVAESTVKATLEEVSSTVSNESSENKTSLLKSYSVDASDLKSYKVQSSYDSGKANPFVDLEEEKYENTVFGGEVINGVVVNKVSGSSSSSTSGSTSGSGEKGTFFEGSTK